MIAPIPTPGDALIRCIEECFNCAQACTSCADTRLAEPMVDRFSQCIETLADHGKCKTHHPHA